MVLSRSQEGRRRSSIVATVRDAPEVPELNERRSSQSPPLLLAPPTTTSNALRDRLRMFLLEIVTMAGPSLFLLSYVIRLGLFAVKITSLTRPCWPFMVQLNIAIPLVAVAALDLGLPRLTSYPPVSRDYFTSGPRAWGLGTSLVLLGLHFTLLWIASGWDNFCAAPQQEEWTQPEW